MESKYVLNIIRALSDLMKNIDPTLMMMIVLVIVVLCITKIIVTLKKD